jgi:hypothetical protein
MRSLILLGAALLNANCQTDGGEPKKQGAQVSDAKHDSSPPLTEIPPAKEKEGQRVHPVKPLPRPKPQDAGTDDKEAR